jgi:hypothetical protein
VRRRYLLLLLLLQAVFVSSASAATTTYLRPNADASPMSWSVTGGTSAWNALNDEVTELQTPGSVDHISTSTSFSRARIDLESTSLAGNKVLSASAWFYTANANPIRFRPTNAENWTTVSSAGWHSVSVPTSFAQVTLDNFKLEFESSSGTSTRVVEAAFLKLTLELATPKIYWGAWMDGDVKLLEEPLGEPGGDAPWDFATWEDFEAHAGKPVSIVHFGQPPPWKQEFAPGPLEYTIDSGAIPLLDMGTYGATLSELAYTPVANSVPLQKFTAWAEDVHNFGHPFFFRLNWEMNLDFSFEFPWANEAQASPSAFKAAWERLHRIAEDEGATNLTWVWCPNVSYPGSTSLKSLFPGSDFVDWTCMDGYNRSPSHDDWLSFYGLFGNTYKELLALNENLPIMIGETASEERETDPTAKAAWIAEAFGTQLTKNFPKIKAVAWFNWNIYDEGTETRLEWPIETSIAARESFANVISSPLFAEDDFSNLPLLEPIQPLP